MPQKLKTYTDESLIPTELKDFYALHNGVYEPQFEGVDSITGVVAKRTELLTKVSGHATEMAGKDAEIQRLSGQLANASSATIPRGHVAVPKADADLLEKVKAAGTPEQVAEMIEKYPTLAAEVKTAKDEKHANNVGEAMGWDKEKTALLVPKIFDLSQVEVRTGSDGKKSVVAKVKQADGVTFTEKPFADVIAQTPELSALAPLLTPTQGGTRVFGSAPGSSSSTSADVFTKTRDEVKAKEAQKPADLNPIFKPKQQAA